MGNFASKLTIQAKRVENSPQQATRVRIAPQNCPRNRSGVITQHLHEEQVLTAFARLKVCVSRWRSRGSGFKVSATFSSSNNNPQNSFHSFQWALAKGPHTHTCRHTHKSFKPARYSVLNHAAVLLSSTKQTDTGLTRKNIYFPSFDTFCKVLFLNYTELRWWYIALVF